MLCKVADLITDIPAADGMSVRCQEYLYGGELGADVTIRAELYRNHLYTPNTLPENIAYLESAGQFYRALIDFNGFFLHSSCVVYNGRAYLFSGDSGAGKSTHARLWLSTLGGDARIINDDKPALRCLDGIWYAYGTPWCGKDGINANERAPIAGVCFMKQSDHNQIRKLSSSEALKLLLRQTIYKFTDLRQLDALTRNLDDFLAKIPVFELENLPVPDAARLCYKTLMGAAPEIPYEDQI